MVFIIRRVSNSVTYIFDNIDYIRSRGYTHGLCTFYIYCLDHHNIESVELPVIESRREVQSEEIISIQSGNRFQGPTDIAVSLDGQVFVCDRNNNRIQVFSIDGTFLRE